MADNKNKPQPLKSLQDLGKILGSTPAAQPPQRTAAPPSRPVHKPVDRADRAGRAPYNFVPLPDQLKWAPKPPDADTYGEKLHSGEIEVEIEALTDFYIRGMIPESQVGKQAKDQPEPFAVNGRLRLPGSSLRGLLRNLVEVMSRAPLDPVNDQQLFYRAVAATPNPNDASSFEPQAATYKARMAEVKAGYLYASSTDWYIRPAHDTGVPGKPAYRYPTTEIWRRDQIWYVPDGERARRCGENDPGARKGWLVCSGRMQGKKNQWIVPDEDRANERIRIRIRPEDVESYRDAGISQEIEKNRFEYGRREHFGKGVPCFYVTWRSTGANGQERDFVAFGHTPNFRMPYQTTTGAAVPPELRRPKDGEKWDLAQAIFGRTDSVDEKRNHVPGAKGRVQIEDAILQGEPTEQWERNEAAVVLGAPKPTTYQHYLVQPSSRVDQALHWDGDFRSTAAAGKAVVRGHKMYWHRPGAPIKPADSNQSRVETKLKVAHRGLRFRTRIRYDNLSNAELGALLRAIELPAGCAHKLGMGKPLGLGSMRLRMASHSAINRTDRYQGFFAADGSLRTGAAPLPDTADFPRAFDEEFGWNWESSRALELKALLTFDHLPEHWNERTRYLEFGKIAAPNARPYIYNEYSHGGYPRRSYVNKRRPLPPATQVLAGTSAAVPTEARPPFEGPALRPNLRGGRR